LIVSTERLHATHGLYVVAMITTARAGVRKDDVQIAGLERAGLPVPCVVRPARLVTMNEAMIGRRLGSLLPKDRNAVAAVLRALLG
jgi:mRNA-degrading endonuclease toxin of MazEF toxin-antitoxin module